MHEPKYTWVKTHDKIVEYLLTKEHKQNELIELLETVGITQLNDKEADGSLIKLEVIDPFTFFCYIYKYGSDKRLKLLQEIANLLKIDPPMDELGLPSANAQKVWLFPYKPDRVNNEIARLWALFKSCMNNTINDDLFADALEIKSTGKTKLTEALFYIKPEKYLPINGPTKPYIKEVLGIEPTFNTYSEYLELLAKIKTKSATPFYELSYQAWKWNSEQKKVNYWIFQGNPAAFDFKTALEQELIEDWTVTAHKDKISKGDKVILWITGNEAGCYALAEITESPREITKSPDSHLWKIKESNKLKAGITITHNLVNTPITKQQIESIEKLSELKIGNQGTNFSATQKEFQSFLNLAENKQPVKYWLISPGEGAYLWDEFYAKGLIGIGWDKISDLTHYNSREQIRTDLIEIYPEGSKNRDNDSLCLWQFSKEMKPGDILVAKKGSNQYIGYGIVSSDYYFDESRGVYKHIRRVDWKKKGAWTETVMSRIVMKTLTDITKFPDYVEQLIALIGIGSESITKRITAMNYPLNQILYGPPGTGKTYNTILKAAQIIKNDASIENYDDALKIFQEHLGNRIEFITFHQNYSYEDFIQGLRPDVENGGNLSFERKDGVFKRIADRAYKNMIESEKPYEIKRNFEEVFSDLISPIAKGEAEEVEIKMKKVSFFITGVGEKSIEFRKNEGDSQHTLSIATLKRMYEHGKNDVIIGGLQPYYNPILSKLIEKGKTDIEQVEKKNFVIIIDEINRANISRVFGELITLIEPDKRYGGEIPLSATLPSGEKFIVPKNLFIIGTMNTADKSIALLDIALRRRFVFAPMYPDYSLDLLEVEVLKRMNEEIIKSKGYDFQIGHSFFMGDDFNLKDCMNDKIIPLLLEYYMNDEKEVSQIILNAGLEIQENGWPIKITGKKQ